MKTNTNTELREQLEELSMPETGQWHGQDDYDEDLLGNYSETLDKAMSLIDQYVHQKEVLTRIQELNHLSDSASDRGNFTGRNGTSGIRKYQIKERIAELQASLNTEGEK